MCVYIFRCICSCIHIYTYTYPLGISPWSLISGSGIKTAGPFLVAITAYEEK